MPTEYAIGIDLGGTNIKVVVVEPSGAILERRHDDTGDRRPADASEPAATPGGAASPWADAIRRAVAQIQDDRGAPAGWLGIAAPGLAAPDQRAIVSLPGKLEGLEGLDWTDYLGMDRVVPVLNDAHGALVGEAWVGAAAGLQDVLLLTLGTGVGGAIVSRGKLFGGHIGRAGHFGHMSLDPEGKPDDCRMPGSLERCIGETTLVERTGGAYPSTRALVEAHLKGDARATAIWLKSVRALACAVASLINIVDPEAVVIGGGIARAGEALFGPLREIIDQVEWQPGGLRVPVLPATLGEYAGALGAARFAMTGP
jgi:glucokinase